MQTTYKPYSPKDSLERMKNILQENDSSFEEVDKIPSSDKLTYTNGFYVDCGVVCCDIRGSSELVSKYKRPKIAKIMKAYISEMVAILLDHSNCREIFIEGDCVWGVFNTPLKSDVDIAFSAAAKIASVSNFLNYSLDTNGFDKLEIGIAVSDGRLLMIKAGYSGSGINEIVWLGEAVNEAHYLCSNALKSSNSQIIVSPKVYSNLKEDNKALLSKCLSLDAYTGSVISVFLEDYYNNNCK